MALLEHWIGGQLQSTRGANLLPVFDPALGQEIHQLRSATPEDVFQAIAAAHAALPIWRDMPPHIRTRILQDFSKLLEERRAILAAEITREHGKTLSDAHSEIQRGLEILQFSLGVPHLLKGQCHHALGADIDNYSSNQPVGICLGITPFSFPVLAPLWMLPIALACGNAFILKPSEKVPSAPLLLAKWLAEVGLPPGVFNVVLGDQTAATLLLNDDRINAVTFAGTSANAQDVYQQAARAGKRVQALGGGKNHAVVMPDADFNQAGKAIAQAAWGLSGQRCMAISVVVAIGDTAANKIITTLSQHAKQIRVGPGVASSVDMGPLISEVHLQRVMDFIESGEAQGARLEIDGREVVVPGYSHGYFCGPCLFDVVTPQMSIYREEIFGPVLCVVRVKSLHEAIKLINENMYGNGAAIFTQNGATANAFENAVDVCMVGVNVAIPAPSAHFSLGGWKASMFGDLHFHGQEGIKFYTRTKVISRRWATEVGVVQGALLHTH